MRKKLNRKTKCPNKNCKYTWRYGGKYVENGSGTISCPMCRTTMGYVAAKKRAYGHPVGFPVVRDYVEVKKLWSLKTRG